MIGIAKLKSAAQAAHYYERDDYYSKSDQLAPSQWWGRAAERLGLSGEVDREAFARALQGNLTKDVSLPRNDEGRRDVGLDLSFNAPKSVSIVALVAGDQRLLAAHRDAVARSLEYLEEQAAIARVTVGGATEHARTGNLLVAQFHHDTSRELDPHLHTHAVVLNATERADGAWRALTNSAFYELRHTADTIYRAELAARIQALGYEVERTRADGQFEIRGFTRESLMHFSKRREAIEAALAERGEAGAEAAQRAALMTRAAKREVDRTELRGLWAREARGIDMPEPGRGRAEREATSRERARKAVLHAIEHLGERSAVVAERDVLKHAFEAHVGEIERADHVFEALREMTAEGQLLVASPELRAAHDLGRFWTTPRALATESAVLAIAEAGRSQADVIVSPDELEAALEARQRTAGPAGVSLTRGQREALTVALTTPDTIVGVQGYAGTGKTTALEAFRELAEAQGFTVRGFAPSAAAAQVLEREAGIPSQTLARHLMQPGEGRADREVWVVDEVSMMGTRTSLQLFRAAERRGARLVLLGDKEQLPSIEAGRVFRMLTERGLRFARMDEVLRQRDPELKQAVLRTIDHRAPDALQDLGERVRSIPTRGKRLDAVAKDYLDAGSARGDVLVLTPSNADRVELNARIRQGLRREGVLRGVDAPAEVLVPRGLTRAQARMASTYTEGDYVRFGRAYRSLGLEAGATLRVERVDVRRGEVHLAGEGGSVVWRPAQHRQVEAYRADARHLAAGDRIRWTRNEHALGRRNGEYAEVLEVDEATRTARVQVGEGEQCLRLDTERHWDHGYAVTAHASQGQTRGRVLVHIDTSQRQLTGHEQWYVSISRAKDDLTIYTDDADRLPGRISRSMQKESALESRQRRRQGWDRQRQLDGCS